MSDGTGIVTDMTAHEAILRQVQDVLRRRAQAVQQPERESVGQSQRCLLYTSDAADE